MSTYPVWLTAFNASATTRNAFASMGRARLARLLLVILTSTVLLTGCSLLHFLFPPPPCELATGLGPQTPSFLGPDDFNGCWTPRASDAATGGESTYLGRIVFTNIKRDMVDDVLPSDLRLAQNSSTSDEHPILLLFGHQTNTQWIIDGTSWPIGNDYTEIAVLIPFVQRAGGSKWHNYIVRMYLNDYWARQIGNLFFGYAKRSGTFQENATDFTALVQGNAVFHAAVQSLGPWENSAAAEVTLPNYKAIQAILEMPILGKPVVGPYLCSYFEMHYDNGMVRRVQSQHEFLQPFTTNMDSWVLLGSINSVPSGAVAIKDVEWRIAEPIANPPWLLCQF